MNVEQIPTRAEIRARRGRLGCYGVPERIVAKVEPIDLEPILEEPEPDAVEPDRADKRDWLMVSPRPAPSIKNIQRAVAGHYGFTCVDICSKRRTAALAKARHVAMYVVKSITPRTLPEIGRHFGGRDHTTILHGVRKIERLLSSDIEMSAEVSVIKSQFEAPQ